MAAQMAAQMTARMAADPVPAAARRGRRPAVALALSALALAACTDGPIGPGDWDLRSASGLNTAEAARQATAPRPQADDRGVISYPGYQVAVARRGDTVTTVAARLGIPADALGRRNAIAPDVALRAGEVLVLPARVAEPSPATGALVTGPIRPPEAVDVRTIAETAIDRAEATRPAPAAAAAPAAPAPAPAATPPRSTPATGREPVRHVVERGETAYTVARRYNVTTAALAEWNGLGPDLALRAGQTLLIPPAAEGARPPPPATAAATPPGAGSPTPAPPSAARPLPAQDAPPAASAPPAPASPDLGATRTAASAARFVMPAEGRIIRSFEPRKNEGIDIGAAAGSPVRAAADGTVAAITRDTDQVPIVVIRHADNLLTVYANVDGIAVAKDGAVRRGQTIARVRAGSSPFLHFEVRRGFEALDPMPFLQ
jgi:murein DD-endopeptidase MepM/ murein hydrolase activator NlpD